MNRPQTAEGWQLWRLVLSLGGQIRFTGGGMAPPVPIGWDMTAALALAGAMGIDAALVAEVLPEIEQAAMRAMIEARDD
ncbi:hypothetical protein OEW28_18635 [Defluviimonas sp. WL0002]|uniref:Uncharacterized protein n=1 Tax=Albidovulum marisflavi TaxID=2984159 RepID=A0ABT2ZHN0_9RHOB|nr:hypothetical protein [Defluviimonas sp. WL0002]MCV2870634.1 hypothetical protein [Defluviimonas sp. WL0002]